LGVGWGGREEWYAGFETGSPLSARSDHVRWKGFLMMNLKPAAMAAVTVLAPVAPIAPDAAEESFHADLIAALKQGQLARKGMVFHVQGTEINGVVKEIRRDVVYVSNHEHARILIRLDRIDAVEGD
jgi:hypothetical protein